jgi:hypothetical protein|uniref:Uncharacterized protein n=1 Tax=viral metagenome TaxID=1070528 RepID=A0A6C0CAG6_9ZZZZ
MLEVQLAMLGLLILKSLVSLIEVICIQIVCLFKSYYISNFNASYSASYSASYNHSQNLTMNYEKNYSYINDYNEIMLYV